MAAPPVAGSTKYRERSALFLDASKSCEKMGAQFVKEAEAQDWAKDVANFIQPKVPLSASMKVDDIA